MNRTLATTAAAAAIGLAACVGAGLQPALADTGTASPSAGVTASADPSPGASSTTRGDDGASHLERLTKSLSGLVDDGTLTQAQLDKVVATLEAHRPQGGPGEGRGHHRPHGHETTGGREGMACAEESTPDLRPGG